MFIDGDREKIRLMKKNKFSYFITDDFLILFGYGASVFSLMFMTLTDMPMSYRLVITCLMFIGFGCTLLIKGLPKTILDKKL